MRRPSTNSRKSDRGRPAPVAVKRAKNAVKKTAKVAAKPNGAPSPARSQAKTGRTPERRTERIVHAGRVAAPR